MRQVLLGTFLMISVIIYGQEQQRVKQVLEKILNHAEEASLYRNTVNWDRLKLAVFEKAKGAKNVSELAPSLKYMLKAIGDDHGRVFHNNQILAYYSSPTKEHQKTINIDTYNEIQSGRVYEFTAQLISDDIGYIRIIGLPMGDNQKMAKKIQDGVCQLVEKGAKKWIVDLRYNGGGNMHPMVEGITQIIGNGKVGGSKGLTQNENSLWTVSKGDFFYDDYSIQLENSCQITSNPKVAVLTSVYTASSGEALAVIFKGRENTKFWGEKSMGMVTVTDWKIIDDSTAMTISVSYYKDRNGIVYDKYVDVDETSAFVKEPLSKNDEAIAKAIKWLNEN